MNLRNVLKVYGLQRQFSDDESALLKTLQSLNDTERDLLVDSLSPAQKKSSKKSAGKGGGGGKSVRASGMAAQLNKTLQQQRQVTTDDDDGEGCYVITEGVRCGASADANVHHMPTDANYHEFQPPQSAAASGG